MQIFLGFQQHSLFDFKYLSVSGSVFLVKHTDYPVSFFWVIQKVFLRKLVVKLDLQPDFFTFDQIQNNWTKVFKCFYLYHLSKFSAKRLLGLPLKQLNIERLYRLS